MWLSVFSDMNRKHNMCSYAAIANRVMCVFVYDYYITVTFTVTGVSPSATHQTETETRTTTENTVQLQQTNTSKNTNYTTHNATLWSHDHSLKGGHWFEYLFRHI